VLGDGLEAESIEGLRPAGGRLQADLVEGVAGGLDRDLREHRRLAAILEGEPVHERLRDRLDRERLPRVADLVEVPVGGREADAEPARVRAGELGDVGAIAPDASGWKRSWRVRRVRVIGQSSLGEDTGQPLATPARVDPTRQLTGASRVPTSARGVVLPIARALTNGGAAAARRGSERSALSGGRCAAASRELASQDLRRARRAGSGAAATSAPARR